MRRKTAYERARDRLTAAMTITEETQTTILDQHNRPMSIERLEGLRDWRAQRPEGGCICTGEDAEPDCPKHCPRSS